MRTALGLLLALAPFAAFAAPVGPTVADNSFESPTTASYTYGPTGSPWNYSGLAGVSANGGPFYTGSAPDGTQAAFLQSGSGSFGQITQTLTGLTNGSTYTFSFYGAERSGFPADPIDVTFGSTDLGTFTPTSTGFVQFTTGSFVANGTSGLLSFIGAVTNQSDIDSAIDLVAINTVSNAPSVGVPEPASMALLATGLIAVALRRKRA